MASSFKLYVQDRKEEAQRETEERKEEALRVSRSSQLEERSKIYDMLERVRGQIRELNKDLASPDTLNTGDADLLQKDRALLMEERNRLSIELQKTYL
ncbi:hypothetical protein GN244_ATG08378 [Phytophthora infestans]|uniref:Uncharacterized protein n=1 Tax=Phytophthora infestans TaxID=4787 RepID=A0A833WKK0_PHYIN|nr:hypothetical protein GN244_ATG08378 [Phytophthora infestans]